MGHVLQMHLFNMQVRLVDNVTLNSPGWSTGTAATDEEYNSGATAEGWATYVGGVAWYNPTVTGVGANASCFGVLLEPPVPLAQGDWVGCMHHGKLPRSVAKAFWDLNDVDNEAGPVFAGGSDDDNCSYPILDESFVWVFFPSGTGNHQSLESGVDGVNTWDYRSYTVPFGTCDQEITLENHNCLQAGQSL